MLPLEPENLTLFRVASERQNIQHEIAERKKSSEKQEKFHFFYESNLSIFSSLPSNSTQCLPFGTRHGTTPDRKHIYLRYTFVAVEITFLPNFGGEKSSV